MNAPETWLALLRVVVGAWFLKAVWTKLVLEFLWGVVPYPVVSERFLAFHPKRVAEFAAGNPVGWYKDFLETTVMPQSRLFATLQAYGEAAVGLGLVLGLLTGLTALVGLFMCVHFALAAQWMSFGQQGFHLLLVTSMVIFLFAPAGVSPVLPLGAPTGLPLGPCGEGVSRPRMSPGWRGDRAGRARPGANVTWTGRPPPVGADLVRASCATSITDTTCACSLATKRRRESAVKRIPRGFRGTAISLTTVSVAVSIRWTSSEVSLETATQRPSGDATAVSGSFPTAIFFVIFSDSASRTVTESSFSLTT